MLLESWRNCPETFEKLQLALHMTFRNLSLKALLTWRLSLKHLKYLLIIHDRGQELLYAGMRISDVFKEIHVIDHVIFDKLHDLSFICLFRPILSNKHEIEKMVQNNSFYSIYSA